MLYLRQSLGTVLNDESNKNVPNDCLYHIQAAFCFPECRFRF